MTVGELRALLANVADDVPVALITGFDVASCPEPLERVTVTPLVDLGYRYAEPAPGDDAPVRYTVTLRSRYAP
jgi:hypothetical protein